MILEILPAHILSLILFLLNFSVMSSASKYLLTCFRIKHFDLLFFNLTEGLSVVL